MDPLALAQARHDEAERAIEATQPKQMNVDLAFKDLFLTYVDSVMRARLVQCGPKSKPSLELYLSPVVHDRARKTGLFAVVRSRWPDLKLYRKREHSSDLRAVHHG